MVLSELGQLHTDAFEMHAGAFFVQLLGLTIDADLVGGPVGPEVQLRAALIQVTIRSWIVGTRPSLQYKLSR